jgi:hypothetical protein
MIRPVTCVCMLLAAGSGLYLYQSKHRAQLLDREIARTLKEADVARDRIGVLRAEYQLLNDPERLAALAAQNLTLATTAPTQFSNWAEFERRLPPVGLPAPAPDPAPEPAIEAKPEPVIASSAPAPEPAPAAVPAPVAASPARPAAPVAVAVAARPAPPRPAPRPVLAAARAAITASALPPPVQLAPRPTQVAATAAPRVHASPRPAPQAAEPRPTPQIAELPPPASAREVIARIARGGRVDPTVPVVASALGMARSMTLPQAVTPASASTYYGAPYAGGGR